ncbi:ABC transporter ATP-binding protein [Rubrivivax sp. A210]|uniref:ABC transporter ATP-binding protein n=1 Tax=Rubrivivax sp. A210 TaxID=2772301 RepID=UPI003986FE3C
MNLADAPPELAATKTAIPADRPAPWLAIERLEAGYGRKAVVQNLSLTLARGSIGCLLGPSGCGKTTVLRAVAGFEPVQAGEIRLDGERVASPGLLVAPEHRRVGMVFQDLALFPHLTVAANVGFGLRGRAGAAERVAQMLDTVGLGAMAQRHPHELSGGQQQRVALARALAPAPRLLLLDEPFSSLDADLRERLGTELRALLKAQGTTALLVTHDQHEAFAIADEIGILKSGKLQQWGTALQLYHRPANRFVAGFIGEGVLLPGQMVDGHAARLELGLVRSAWPLHCADCGDALGGSAAVDLLVRPQDLTLDDDAPVQGRLLSRAFRGAETLYTLALDSGATVLALAPSDHEYAVGSRIGLRLTSHDLVLFRRSGANAANDESPALTSC